jgi:hypothetical protein
LAFHESGCVVGIAIRESQDVTTRREAADRDLKWHIDLPFDPFRFVRGMCPENGLD